MERVKQDCSCVSIGFGGGAVNSDLETVVSKNGVEVIARDRSKRKREYKSLYIFVWIEEMNISLLFLLMVNIVYKKYYDHHCLRVYYKYAEVKEGSTDDDPFEKEWKGGKVKEEFWLVEEVVKEENWLVGWELFWPIKEG